MKHARRIEIGDALASAGLWVRRVSGRLAAVALAALLAGALVIPIDGGFARLSDLAPFDRIPIESGWWTLGAPLAILLACRAVAVGIAAAGWVVFPLEYRARLAAIALREEAGHPVP